MLLSRQTLASYFDRSSERPTKTNEHCDKINNLADRCRQSYLKTGIAHIPNFLRQDIVQQMVQEATHLQNKKECFYSTDSHTVYQEEYDPNFPNDHPRNALQTSSKYIVDFARIPKPQSPLYTLYTSPEIRAFVSYVVRPEENDSHNNYYEAHELFQSGCDYNAAYYNIYGPGDGLGWHFDRSDFGINLELQRPKLKSNCGDNSSGAGGDFELCWKTRIPEDPWCFEKVKDILNSSDEQQCSKAERIQDPPVGPGSLVFFAGNLNLHRVTPVNKDCDVPRVNAIMTFEKQPGQRPNAYSLEKFFGR
mgnify:CR=1 FL=1